MPAVEAGAKLVASKPGGSHTKSFAGLLDSNANSTGSGKITTPDNKKLNSPNELVSRQPQSFDHILDKKTLDKNLLESQSRKKSKIQTQNPIMLSSTQSAVPPTVQELPTTDAKGDKAGLIKVKNQFQYQVESVNPGKLARFVTNAKIAPLSQITTLGEVKPENKPLSSANQKSQAESETASRNISNKPNVIPTQAEKKKDTGKSQLSNKASVPVEKLVNQESRKESLREMLPANSKESLAGETQIVSDNSKAQLPDKVFAALQNQAPQVTQKVSISQQSLAQAARETTVDRIETDRRGFRGKLNPFELRIKSRGLENQSAKSASQKIAQSPVQLSAAQAENHSDSLPSRVSNQDVEPGAKVLFSTDNQWTIREQASTASDFTNIAANADSAANIREQIEGAIHSSFGSNNQQIVIRLNPPELGKVSVKFQEQSDDVAGIIHVEKPQTKQQLQQSLPEIIQNLQNSGIQVKSIEVVLTHQQEQYGPRDQSAWGQNNWSGQQNSSNPEPQRNTYNEFITNTDGVTGIMESHAKFFDGSINILI